MDKLLETISQINEVQLSEGAEKSLPYYDKLMTMFEDKSDWRYIYVSLWRELAMAKCGNIPSLVMINNYQEEAQRRGYDYISTMADCIRVMALFHLDKSGFGKQMKMVSTAKHQASDTMREEKMKKLISDYRNAPAPQEKKTPVAVKTVQKPAVRPEIKREDTAEEKKRKEMEHIIGVIRELSSMQSTANKNYIEEKLLYGRG